MKKIKIIGQSILERIDALSFGVVFIMVALINPFLVKRMLKRYLKETNVLDFLAELKSFVKLQSVEVLQDYNHNPRTLRHIEKILEKIEQLQRRYN